MRKQFLLAIAAMALGLVFTPGNASAEDEGYNTSDTDTVIIGSDPMTGGPTQEDYDAMESIQQQMQDLKDRHSGEAEGGSESGETSGE
jgi:hypothetical protein